MFLKSKISIIIPCYGTEKYVKRCLESVINQTYKDLEIIVVNDCSLGEMKLILEDYRKKDDRIKIINHEKNMGLFQARLSGAKIATGNYIAFLDSDDYVDLDFYRELIFSAEERKSDIVVSNIVIEEENKKNIYNLFYSGKDKLEKEQIFEEFFNQEGYNYSWYVIWNKIYKMDLWKKASKYYYDFKDHLIMTEDFAFSTILFYYANSLIYNYRANYFYCSNENASTSLSKLTVKKCEKNVTDIGKSFDFIEKFLKEKKIYNKYEEKFKFWRALYLKIWYDNIKHEHFELKDEENLIKLINNIDPNFLNYDYSNKDNFYKVKTEFNDKLMKLKSKILETDIISFDIFDTLIIRPFYEPQDLFTLLNNDFNILFESNGLLEFSKIRIESERYIRRKMYEEKGYEDVKLDEIYDTISTLYGLSLEKLKVIKTKETELEMKFCKRRNTMYSIYSMCKYLNKHIMAISDMYLPRNIIERILETNGYEYFNSIYISNEERLSKKNGNLYKLVVVEQKIHPNRILHIGDNIKSDVEIPKSLNINFFFFPKTIDVLNNYCWRENNVNYCGRLYENFQLLNIDHEKVTEYMGNRISLALVANKFFDNPFTSFNENTDFNCNPYQIGYYALGMHMLSLCNWILTNANEKKYDNICFQARDGYLPFLATQKMKKVYDLENLHINYIYVSRKALMPLVLNEYKDFYIIKDYLNLDKITISDLLNNLRFVLKLNNDYEQILNKNGLYLSDLLDDEDRFYKLINIIYYNFYDKNKYNEYLSIAKKYFSDSFIGKSATFDIGYSAKPELIISNIIEKKIDTYFVHCNNDTAYKNSKYGNFKLNSFYNFKPTFYGTLREYMFSSNSPSCIGYKMIDNDIKIEYDNREIYTYFDKKMLEELHIGCLDFIDTYISLFKDYNIIELNSYYMSIPFEYYLHYSKETDRNVFLNLKFENNVSEKIEIIDFWKNRINNYTLNYNQFKNVKIVYKENKEYTYNNFLDERVKHRNKVSKFLFYIKYDRVALRNKFKYKLSGNNFFSKSARKIYRVFKRK